jgi:galactonate dehydratase
MHFKAPALDSGFNRTPPDSAWRSCQYPATISPHDASGSINILAGAHVMASVPNHYRVETHRAKLNAYDVFIDHPLDIRGDKIYLSDRPGLGIELDKDYMRGHIIEGYGG